MKSSVTKTFRKRLSDLPASVQEQAAKAYAFWQEDPSHPRACHQLSQITVAAR